MASSPEHLHGLVDMGSNGIRFSITDLAPSTARILPTLHQSRVGISLYDAQYQPGSPVRRPIPDSVIDTVVLHLLKFKQTCADHAVPESHITVLATEATRTAPNSVDFLARIRQHTGWGVTLLTKDDEGRVGAMGVASSLGAVSGLMMDLGGGSTQLTWLSTDSNGAVSLPANGSVSMPYGAAALKRRLEEAQAQGETAVAALTEEIGTAVKNAYVALDVPDELLAAARAKGGFTLYLSGGGFRGWGYILLSSTATHPYPIPIINGFSAPRAAFLDTAKVQAAVSLSSTSAPSFSDDDDRRDDSKSGGIFRVSARRASQVPAVAFLVSLLATSIPSISEVRFCQGGVREGFLFSSLAASVQAQSPLAAAGALFSAETPLTVIQLLRDALPHSTRNTFHDGVLTVVASALHHHASQAKDSRQPSALRFTTTGAMAGVHGLSHSDRAIVALVLCERWGARKDLPESDGTFHDAMVRVVGDKVAWWCRLLGKVAGLVGAVAPNLEEERIKVKTMEEGNGLLVRVAFAGNGGKGLDLGSLPWYEVLYGDELEDLRKVGKKKNWIGGYGHKVQVKAH